MLEGRALANHSIRRRPHPVDGAACEFVDHRQEGVAAVEKMRQPPGVRAEWLGRPDVAALLEG